MDLETRIKDCIKRILQAPLSDAEKTELFSLMTQGMHELSMASVVGNMNTETLEKLSAQEKVSAEEYENLLVATLTQTQALPQLADSYDAYVTDIEHQLTAAGI